MPSKEHIARIHDELAKAGMSTYGHFKMTSRHLPNIIAEDEHIGGVVYGVCPRGLAMVVATDQRVIYLERKPGFISSDEISYDVVAGVKHFKAAMVIAVTLHTRVGDYTLRYVNPKCAETFIHFIEKRLEEHHIAANGASNSQPTEKVSAEEIHQVKMTEEVKNFLSEHDVGVLSTSSRTGDIDGAVVYYLFGNGDNLYILTKSDTTKAKNILGHNEVAFTVFDPEQVKTTQIKGVTKVENDLKVRQEIFDLLTRPRNYDGKVLMPPLTQIDAGAFVPLKIIPTSVKYSDFKRKDRIIPTHNPEIGKA